MPFYKTAKPINPMDIMALSLPLYVNVPAPAVTGSQTMDYLRKMTVENPEILKHSPLTNTPALREKALMNLIKERAVVPRASVPLPLYQQGGLVMERDDELIVPETRITAKERAELALARGEPVGSVAGITRLSAKDMKNLAVSEATKKTEERRTPVAPTPPTGMTTVPEAVAQYAGRPAERLNVGRDETENWFTSGASFEDLSNQTGDYQFQQGGTIPGGGKGDIIPIAAEPDEYIIPREVVLAKGTDFFDNLIKKTKTKGKSMAQRTLPQYEQGGSVEGEEVAGMESYNPNRPAYQNTPQPPRTAPMAPPAVGGRIDERFMNVTGGRVNAPNPNTIRLKREMGLPGYQYGGTVLPPPFNDAVNNYVRKQGIPSIQDRMMKSASGALPGYQPGGPVNEEERWRRMALGGQDYPGQDLRKDLRSAGEFIYESSPLVRTLVDKGQEIKNRRDAYFANQRRPATASLSPAASIPTEISPNWRRAAEQASTAAVPGVTYPEVRRPETGGRVEPRFQYQAPLTKKVAPTKTKGKGKAAKPAEVAPVIPESAMRTPLTGGVPVIESAITETIPGTPYRRDVGRTAGETAGMVQTGKRAYAFYPEGTVSPDLTPEEADAVRATIPAVSPKEKMPEVMMGGYTIPGGLTPEESMARQGKVNMAYDMTTPVALTTRTRGGGTAQRIIQVPDTEGRMKVLYPEAYRAEGKSPEEIQAEINVRKAQAGLYGAERQKTMKEIEQIGAKMGLDPDALMKGYADIVSKLPANEKLPTPQEFVTQWQEVFGSTEPPMPGAKKGNDANWYVADPKRPGKYMKVVQ